MSIQDLLIKIRDPWLTRISHELGKGEKGRDYLIDELNRFYDLLIQSVESGDPGWLKPLLIDWSSARTESELQEEKLTLSPILSSIVIETFSIAREHLTSEEVISLINILLPIFDYSYEQIAQHEAIVRIGYISTRLETVQTKLENLDRSKSDFIAVAAHELKTPLTLIEGYTAMLKEQYPDEGSDSAVTLLLKGIDNGPRRLGEIIDDMIDVSMIDNNLLALNFQPTWVNRLLSVLQQELRESVEERNQTLEIKDFEGSNEMTFADSERIYQALRNVLTNAIKYTPDGGKITVDGRMLTGFIEVLVTDTGIGIQPDDQDRIFEKFARVGEVALHSSGKIKFKGGGPGLGLQITKGIMEAHGGTIWVESEGYDEKNLPGSTFHILIPVRTEPPDEAIAKLFQPTADSDLPDSHS